MNEALRRQPGLNGAAGAAPEYAALPKRRDSVPPFGLVCGLLYFVWALPLLLALAWIVPPWTTTDEPSHMLRAVSIAHGHIISTRFDNRDPHGPPGSGGLSDMAIFQAFEPLASLSWLPHQPDGQVSRDILNRSNAVKWSAAESMTWFGGAAPYPPVFYLPDAAAYWLGRAADLGINTTLKLARSVNAVLFAAIGAIAIARARRLRPLLTILLMLPMSLASAASASQDGAMIALLALTVAQFDRLADAVRQPGRAELIIMAAALACVAASRPPYIGLLLLLPAGVSGRAGWRACLGAAAAVGVWSVLQALFVLRPPGGADPAAQLHILLAHPFAIVTIMANTMRLSGWTYAWEFIGRLSWNDVPLPLPYLLLAWVTILVAAAASSHGRALPRRMIAAGTLIGVTGIFALLFLDWTPPGADHTEGVTGRYFIPLAIAGGVALPNVRAASRLRTPAYVLIALVAALTPAGMLHHLIFHFYVRAV